MAKHVFALTLLLAACSGQGTQVASVGAPAPAFSEPTVAGPTLSMDSLKGKPVFIDFFATWCPPCNEEAPDVQNIAQTYKAAGLQVVGVDVLENAAKAKQFVDQHHLTYPAVVDSGALRDAYQINGMPVAVFIDKSGNVKKIETGEITKEEMLADVKAIL